jgi:hypothetical protein
MLASVLAMVAASPALSATILGYTSVEGTSMPLTTVGSGVTGTNILRGPGVAEASAGSLFNTRNWTTGAASTSATAIANGDYLQFSMTSLTAYDLQSMAFGYSRSNNGPKSIAVDLIVNSITYSNFFVDSAVTTATKTANLDLSFFESVTSLTFRMSGFNAQNTAGSFQFENVLAGGEALRLSGELTPPPPPPPSVPLPASFGLLALALLAIPRRRKSKVD